MRIKVDMREADEEKCEDDIFKGLGNVPKCPCGNLAYIYTEQGCYCNNCSPNRERKVKEEKMDHDLRYIEGTEDYALQAMIIRETEKAILINFKDKEVWLPKSQIGWDDNAIGAN